MNGETQDSQNPHTVPLNQHDEETSMKRLAPEKDDLKEALKEAFDYWLDKTDLRMLNLSGFLVLSDSQAKPIRLYSFADKEGTTDFPFAELNSGYNAMIASAQAREYRTVSGMEHEPPFLVKYRSSAIPLLTSTNEVVGFLGWFMEEPAREDISFVLQHLSISLNSCILLYLERQQNMHFRQSQLQSAKEAQKRDMLYQAAKKLHSKIDVDSVLEEVLHNIHALYPSIEIDLMLSQDNLSSSIPVKPLSFQNPGNDICTRAFMEGQLIMQKVDTGNRQGYSTAAVPLCGKQGVYGVLHLKLTGEMCFSPPDIQFISMLADAAGTAFENAKLYEQSNLLIHELRLINEITKKLNQSLKPNEIFDFACSELMKIFGAEFCCILQIDYKNQKLIVKASNLPSIFQESFEVDYGFSGIVFETKEPLIISDYSVHKTVTSKLMESTGARSLIASPILVNGEVVGVSLVAHRKPNFFSYDNFKLLQVLSGHLGLAITNASLHSEVRRMVITDNLTGLYARHYLYEQIHLLQKKDYRGSLILVDIDHFKQVNDTYGHQVGDQILVHVSEIIKSSIREGDIASRWGGEELAIYLPQVTIDQTLRIADRIRVRVMNETQPQVTVSCGVSEWSWEDEKVSVENLFYKADMALYTAKDGGRNQIKVG